MTDDFHFYLLRRADDYVTAIRPTADIDRFGFPAWHGWAISKAWRDGYAAAINEGGQAPCESTDGCTRAQVTWEQAISHAGTDHEMAAQPVPPSPDAEAERDVLYREYIAARTEAEAVKAERDALRAQLREIARLWDMPSACDAAGLARPMARRHRRSEEGMSEGAVDLDACPTERSRFGRCRCGPCKICGFAKHSGAHGPVFGYPPGSKPYLHEYEPEIDDHSAIDAGRKP